VAVYPLLKHQHLKVDFIMSDLYLSNTEVQCISGYKQVTAQRKAIISMGYTVKIRPDGSFWVPRAQFLVDDKEKAPTEKKYKLDFGALRNGKAA